MSNYGSTYTLIDAQGTIKIRVGSQKARERWEQELLKAIVDRGESMPKGLRYQCRVAQDVNKAFASVGDLLGTPSLQPNPNARAQFGSTDKGLPYLTVGVIDNSTGERYQFRWEGDAVPTKLVEIAVKHDQGRATRATDVQLDLAKARVSLVEKKPSPDPRSRHDVDPRGRPHPLKAPARKYGRCSPLTLAVAAS